MKALGIEVKLEQDQINNMVLFIRHNYPEVFGQIWQEGYDSYVCSCAIEDEDERPYVSRCPECHLMTLTNSGCTNCGYYLLR